MGSPVQIGEWLFSAKTHSTAISPDRQSVYSFDLEGRPISWFERERVFKRSLASDVHGRERMEGRRRRWVASGDEAAGLFAALIARVSGAPVAELPARLRARLDDILRWTPESLLDERRRFDAVYRPISILPPDQYLAVVLQATFGCSWNRCAFCSFYQDRPFTARPVEEFRSHARGVRDLLGRGEALRSRIFLADGNALILSSDRLRPIFEAARGEFPRRSIGGFVDVLTGERKAAAEWRALRDWGLERVYVGLETGHDDLLAWMNKPGKPSDARAFVSTLKAAGLSVAAILMCGVGGDRFAGPHVRDTLKLVGGLPLREGDIVYLSPFVDEEGSTYSRKAAAEGVRPLEEAEIEDQYARLRDGIRAALPGVRVARYDIREFVY